MRRVMVLVLGGMVLLAACHGQPADPTPTLSPLATLPASPLVTESPIPLPPPTTAGMIPPPVFTDPPPRPVDYIVVNATPPRRVPNALRDFWVTNCVTGEQRQITARLRVQTEHVAMWVEDDVWHDVRLLARAATLFETDIYSTTRLAFGSEWTPGIDNDPHIHILHATGLGHQVIGYMSVIDAFPQEHYPTSNQAEMIYVNADLVEINSPTYHALVANQFQRLIQWHQDSNESRWLKEGLAQLAVHLSGIEANHPQAAYMDRPDTSLTIWEEDRDAAHRGAAYLLAVYLHERFGDAATQALVAEPLNGIAGLDATLNDLTGLTFEHLYTAWLVANYLDSQPAAAGRYGYRTLDVGPPALAAAIDAYPHTLGGTVSQFGADYISLGGDEDLIVRFSGVTETR